MNSSFTASNPFYHLQQNFDGTSVLRKVLRHINKGLGCKEEGFIREGNLPIKKMDIIPLELNKQVNSALPGVELVSIIYKNKTSDLLEDNIILNYYLNCLFLLLLVLRS